MPVPELKLQKLAIFVTLKCNFYIFFVGILDPVLELAGQYNVIDSSVNISWLPPPALAVFPAAMPERFYCVEVINQTSPSMSVIDSIGCDQTTNQSDETSFLLTNVVCGTNYAITVTSFNRIGDGGQSTVLFPGM